jgi:four helix bundle suffix protein
MSDRSDWSDNPEVAANTLICLIHQATYLLRRQMEALEQTFLQEGGFTEKLYRARTTARVSGQQAQ